MKYINGEIKIDVYDDIIQNMTPEQRKQLQLEFVWDEETLNEFVDKLTVEFAASSYNSVFYKARLRFIEQMPEAARSVIRSLLVDKARAEHHSATMERWAWALWHAWPDRNKQPHSLNPPKYTSPDAPQSYEITALLDCAMISDEAKEQSWKERFDNHVRIVGSFLNQMYAVMIDPLAEGTVKVEDTVKQLLAAAIESRQREAEAQLKIGNLESQLKQLLDKQDKV